jgi:hypothetical protein
VTLSELIDIYLDGNVVSHLAKQQLFEEIQIFIPAT